MIAPALLASPTFSVAEGQTVALSVVEGTGNAVCQAFVTALDSAAPPSKPWCLNDLNPSVEGFPKLHRQYITDIEDAFVLRYRIQGFLSNQNQFSWEKQDRFVRDRAKNRYWTEWAMKKNKLSMWRYTSPIDIDNDGVSDHVLWYQDGGCDSSRPIFSVLLIVDPRTLTIDETSTRRLFAEPRPYPVLTNRFIQLRAGYLGMFQYERRYYVYAWGTDEAWTKAEQPSTTARVYLIENDKMATVCEVRWNPEAIKR